MAPFADFYWFIWITGAAMVGMAILFVSRRPYPAAGVFTLLMLASWPLWAGLDTVLRFLSFVAFLWTITAIQLGLVRKFGKSIYLTCVLVFAACTPVVAIKFQFLHLLAASFILFRALQVIFDIHDGRVKSLNHGKYLLFLAFFPTLFAGPIDRFQRFCSDLGTPLKRREILVRFELAFRHLWLGLLYKFVLAHILSLALNTNLEPYIGSNPITHDLAYLYIYGFYLVLDFAGYAAIAIAYSLMVGIQTPENVNAPFYSLSIREFWTRMHITLSFWFRDYVLMRLLLFIRRHKLISSPLVASIVSLFISFGLMGFWHGATIPYVSYGLFHAALLSAQEVWEHWHRTGAITWRPKKWLAWLVTFHLILISFAIFSGYVPKTLVPRDTASLVGN